MSSDVNVTGLSPAETAIAEAALPMEKQKAIWDVEHLTFELETRFGKPFVESIKAQDKERLRTLAANV